MINKILIILLLVSVNTVYGQTAVKKDIEFYQAKAHANPRSKYYNPAKAVELFTKVAEKGKAEAMNELGMLYLNGTGVDKNYETALQWFEKAAALNNIEGRYHVGFMYKFGYGAPQDFKKAYTYFDEGAEQGDIRSIYHKGYMHYKGFGCEQDYKIAFELFNKSANRHTGSMYMLGLCYRNGFGVEVNLDSARHWLSKSAETGDKRAIAELQEPEAEISFEKKLEERSRISGKPLVKTAEKTYRKVQQQAKKNEVAGLYKGYLIRYDWSGKHILGQSETSCSTCSAGHVELLIDNNGSHGTHCNE